jgi:hypothetical protein
MIFAASTPVSRASRPWCRTENRSWLNPSRCSTVAWKVADVDRILDDVVAEVVGLAVDGAALVPPPAIHMVKQRGWWSRP